MSGRCTMGVGCEEAGVCYADAHGWPDMCRRPTGDQLKAEGQARAAEGKAWTAQALDKLLDYLTIQGGALFTFDGFRSWASASLPAPASANAWGSLPRSAVAAGLIVPTGHTAKAKRAEAHARVVRVWAVA